MIIPTYLIFGAKGIIGSALFKKLCEVSPDYRIFRFDHGQADVSNKKHIKEIIDYVRPTEVFNCAGLSNPELCEQAEAGAYEVNAVAPGILAEECARIKAKLVHFSSSAVFSGRRFMPYSERCKPDPINVLGKSKLEGELAIRKVSPNHLIIRPGWAFNFESSNFLIDWISRIDRKMHLRVRPNCHGSPIFVPDLVDHVVDLVERDAKGVFHIANSQATTWEGLAEAVVDLVHGRSKVLPLTKATAGFLAPMPTYLILSCKKLREYTGIEARPWPNALKQCLFHMERYKP